MNDKTLTIVIGVCVSVLIITIGSCEIYERALISEMVKNKVDPTKARCAFTQSQTDPRCFYKGMENDK